MIRSVTIALAAFALAACGGGDGEELSAGNSSLSQAEIDAALGPADQDGADDGLPSGNSTDGELEGSNAVSANAASNAEDTE